jgi:hypothetical protein
MNACVNRSTEDLRLALRLRTSSSPQPAVGLPLCTHAMHPVRLATVPPSRGIRDFGRVARAPDVPYAPA